MTQENARIRLELRNLQVHYTEAPAFECNELDLTGSVIAVIGPNGAGKSTLIKTVLGLLEPRRGHLSAFFLPAHGNGLLLTPEQHMAFCPENGAVFSDIKVEDYLTFWCRVRRHDGTYYRREGAPYLELLDLERLLDKKGSALSKGERRRVQTCVGFLLNPKLFLFDEPFDGLDVQRTHELVSLVRQHQSTNSFIISSHRMDVVERLADQVMILDEGTVVTSGTSLSCAERMAGKTLILGSGRGSSEKNVSLDLSEELRKTFPHALITERGGVIYLTGATLNKEEITQLLTQRGFQHEFRTQQSPTLVDAMTLYLRRRKERRPSDRALVSP